MVVYRFMSFEEWYRFESGALLFNSTDHGKVRGEATDAYGFCFGIGDKEKALEDLRRLRGVISIEVLVWGELAEGRVMNRCKGRYPDYEKMDRMGKTVSDFLESELPHKFYKELCTSSYSCRDFLWLKHVEYPDPKTPEITLSLISSPLYCQLYERIVGHKIMGELERYAKKNLETMLNRIYT